MANDTAQTTEDMIRDYVALRTDMSSSWEKNGLRSIGENPTIDRLLESVHDSNPDARIKAIQILGYCAPTYSTTTRTYVAGEISKRLDDHSQNSVGSFQCDEEDFITVAQAARDALKHLGYTKRD